MLNYKIEEMFLNFHPVASDYVPQHIDIRDKNTDMMNDGSSGYPLVDQDIGKVLDYVHGSHVDHYLGIRCVLHGVQYTDIPLVNGYQPNKTESFVATSKERMLCIYLIRARRRDSIKLIRINVCLSKLTPRNLG